MICKLLGFTHQNVSWSMLTWSYFACNSKNMGQYGSDTLRRKEQNKLYTWHWTLTLYFKRHFKNNRPELHNFAIQSIIHDVWKINKAQIQFSFNKQSWRNVQYMQSIRWFMTNYLFLITLLHKMQCYGSSEIIIWTDVLCLSICGTLKNPTAQ